MAQRRRSGRGFLRWFRRKILTGLLITLPVVLTLYVLYRIFIWVDGILKPLSVRYPYLDIPGLGFLGVILIVLAAGVLGGGIIGRTLLRWIEGGLEKIPMVRGVYATIKQISEVFLKEERSVFDRVVIVEYPRSGMYMLGFVTANWRLMTRKGSNEDMLAVFIPTSPNPTSGFLVVVPPEDAFPTELSVQEAFKVIISGGAVVPEAEAIGGKRRAGRGPSR